MLCKEAQRLIVPYIKEELTDEELEKFLGHVNSCPDCMEELEIYFMVEAGIRQLDSETGSYDIKGALTSALEQSGQRLRVVRLVKIVKYAVSALSVAAFLITVFLQYRIWLQKGWL